MVLLRCKVVVLGLSLLLFMPFFSLGCSKKKEPLPPASVKSEVSEELPVLKQNQIVPLYKEPRKKDFSFQESGRDEVDLFEAKLKAAGEEDKALID